MISKIRRIGFPTNTPPCRELSHMEQKGRYLAALPAISRRDSVIRNPPILPAFLPPISCANYLISKLEPEWARR